MKKINYKKIFLTVLWLIAGTGICISLAFVSKSEKNVVVKNINISIHGNDENLFLTVKDIKQFLISRNQLLVSNQLKNIRIPELEKVINSHPAVQNAEVAADMDGEIKIDVIQRTPVCRIINSDGESYYIDSQNKLMPLNENYSARVILVNGFINEPFSKRYEYTINQIKENKLFKQISLLDDIMEVVCYINADPDLSLLIHQIFVNEEQEFEILPSVGGQKIILGASDCLLEKFNKLKLFYTQGLNKTDGWNKYSAINLKYKNLVVCTKK